MITEKSRKNARKYCRNDISLIEGYDEAMKSPEKYSVHHVLEFKYDTKVLEELGMYYSVHQDFLIWMPFSVHHNNCVLHANRMKHNKNMYKNGHKPWNKKEVL